MTGAGENVEEGAQSQLRYMGHICRIDPFDEMADDWERYSKRPIVHG